jgi:hypothetical protein
MVSMENGPRHPKELERGEQTGRTRGVVGKQRSKQFFQWKGPIQITIWVATIPERIEDRRASRVASGDILNTE